MTYGQEGLTLEGYKHLYGELEGLTLEDLHLFGDPRTFNTAVQHPGGGYNPQVSAGYNPPESEDRAGNDDEDSEAVTKNDDSEYTNPELWEMERIRDEYCRKEYGDKDEEYDDEEYENEE